ncbi:hypothetical protein C7C46_16225 [Streptomyces tateyamensis]|uniref:Uncharacterized protein n=1 Tax=Streptomyces tateyamensis TaxID=565073 RepID=A0A2V4N3D7_9ACTN|nr:hypothetical protein [Streptomyces tateyamensis]PYC78381.1 hypothetical protein C7C46_16225 [Streptomyces tateyamensis]
MSSEANVEFDRIEPEDLRQVPVIAQALDNQWLAAGELRGVWRGDLSRRAALRHQDDRVRTEYIRALVNGEQVVVNRAYLYNNPAVTRDFLTDSPEREAFKQLLGEGTLVPFLWNEASPVQQPLFGVAEQGWQAWERVCQETRPVCLRMAWDEAANSQDGTVLGREFSRYAHDLNLMDFPALARALEVPAERQDRLRERFLAVAEFSNDRIRERGLVLRDELYRHFVVREGSNPADRAYDPTREFGAEIKQVVDLAYNINLADRLGAFALTPQGSMPRSALQESVLRWATQKAELSPEQLVEIVRRTAFEVVQEGLYVESFAELALPDVLALRQTPQWQRYLTRLQALLADPRVADPGRFGDPEHGAPAVVSAYVAMVREASARVARRKVAARMARWTPQVELLVEVATASVRVIFGAHPAFEILGEVTRAFANRAAPVVVRLVVNRSTGRSEQARLEASLRLIEGRFAGSGLRQWETLVADLRKAGFAEVTGIDAAAQAAELGEPEPVA